MNKLFILTLYNDQDGVSTAMQMKLDGTMLKEQHIDAVLLSIPAGQFHGEVSKTSHEGVTVSVVDNTHGNARCSNCTDHPEKATPFNSSSMGQTSNGFLSSRLPWASSLDNINKERSALSILTTGARA
ncbi:hypothetical protein TanjilG_17019 [Lupinus angustifolius]|nr:hypothetical protein TanjilG_17019 [Lupinus angustifolius]